MLRQELGLEEPLKAVFIDTYRDVNSPAEVQKFNVSFLLITSVTDPNFLNPDGSISMDFFKQILNIFNVVVSHP